MWALSIGPAEREAIARVVAYARQREHWYRIPGHASSPGDNALYVCLLPFEFRCVFTYTFHTILNRLYRHLSVSTPGKSLFPTQQAVGEIATAFGFIRRKDITDWPSDWEVALDDATMSVAVAQCIVNAG